jgi:hypothetical protein
VKRRFIVLVVVVLGALASPSLAWAPMEGGGGPDDMPQCAPACDTR